MKTLSQLLDDIDQYAIPERERNLLKSHVHAAYWVGVHDAAGRFERHQKRRRSIDNTRLARWMGWLGRGR